MTWIMRLCQCCSCFLLALSIDIATASADGVTDVDWDSLPLTKHSDLQAVDGNGVRTFPTDVFPVRLRGILLNNPEDMLDGTPFEPNLVPFDLGASWQVFIQAVEEDDFGGTAVFMGQHYGNVPPNLGPGSTPDPSRSYTNSAWNDEIARVNVDRATGHVFRAGDLVEIHGQGALYFGGKTNINEEHFIESELDFELELISAGYGLPAPAPLRLADIWNEENDQVLFDETRQSGGERFQGELVQLQYVRLIDDGTPWAPDSLLTVTDGDGREFALHLGLSDDFSSILPPDGFFHAVGIFNQESGGPAGPGTGGYEVWVMDPASITPVAIAGDANGDGKVDGLDYLTWVANFDDDPAADPPGSPANGDFNDDGKVDGLDYLVWAGAFGQGPNDTVAVPEPSSLVILALGIAGIAWRSRRRSR
ncbi:MAG: PEP-CTERM sorting domain-containing protein [Pirellulales bacterium]